MKTTTILAVVALLGCLLVGACNTAHGFGKDVENTGDYIQHKTDNSGS